MEFDVTNLDKSLLIQSLYAHSAPIGLGKAKQEFLKINKKVVYGIDEIECENYLNKFYNRPSGIKGVTVIDYHNGVPIKLGLYQKLNGRIITNSSSYDLRTFRFRFLEAMLKVFEIEDIKIIKKGYPQFLSSTFKPENERNKEDNRYFKNLISNSFSKKDKYGIFFQIDSKKTPIRDEFKDLLI